MTSFRGGRAASSLPVLLADAASAKRALRGRIRVERRGRSGPRRRADADAIATALLELPEIAGARCVTAYASTGAEPGTAPLRAALAAAGIRVLLPVVLPHGVLDWSLDAGPLRPASGLGGPEPLGPRLGTTSIRAADALIVPAIAVDTLGRRLGQGGGYYDRALRLVDPTVPVIAVVHEDEVLDAAVEPVPAEPHDGLVDAVVTPLGCLRLGRLIFSR